MAINDELPAIRAGYKDGIARTTPVSGGVSAVYRRPERSRFRI